MDVNVGAERDGVQTVGVYTAPVMFSGLAMLVSNLGSARTFGVANSTFSPRHNCANSTAQRTCHTGSCSVAGVCSISDRYSTPWQIDTTALPTIHSRDGA
jgi:hypothetical protein